ncbi:hypothetical protein [Flavobacterium sp. GSB-24]|uniref:hypothetical protein n=1 Tax=Flavobacterium sp. GSB-24 TaxID=2994319 RepID=UPI0024936827|nr:hypothetical protein [Flavobacterium sp. GSB-24]BDU25154.1 hypothetical protein FLGSB24_18980 [Flavobacterium sp. GSB-24]
MYNHTLTVSTARKPFPNEVSIDFVTSLINRGVAMVEYFGPEIDNCEDYVEEDMKLVSEQISYFEFYFSTEQSIDYDALSETEVDQILFDAIKKSDKIKLQSDQKDIMIYL